METRVAIIGIIVSDLKQSKEINQVLHENSDYILGRIGIPYPKEGISIMSIILDAPEARINSMSGKIGSLKGVSVKVQYHNK